MQDRHVAAIDLGTNSCRMVIADLKGNYVYRTNLRSALGDGMCKDMSIDRVAFDRAVDMFREIRKELDKYNIAGMRAIATAACRTAENGRDFVKKVYDETGIQLEIIDAFEETRLTLKGAISHVLGKSRYVLIYDIGGGSTEVTLAENNRGMKIIYTVSIPWGGRNASETFGINDYSETAALRFKAEIGRYMDEFIEKTDFFAIDKKDVICAATSSTGLRAAAIVEGSGEYDREAMDGKTFAVKDFDRAVVAVYKMNFEERKSSPYIGHRADIITAAFILFKTIYDDLKFEKVLVSLRGAQDGIIEELIEKHHGKVD